MGLIPGLATIATTLLVLVVLASVAVLALTFIVVVPAMRETRVDRLRRRVSIPTYYLHPAAAH